MIYQRAKKVVLKSQWLVDFAVGLEASEVSWEYFEEIQIIKVLLGIKFLGLVRMTFGLPLIHHCYGLPAGQTQKLVFFALISINNLLL